MIAIFSRIKMNRKQIVSVVLFTMFATIAQMMIPMLISIIINDGVSDNKVSLIIILGIIMIALAVFACAFYMTDNKKKSDSRKK